MTLDEKCFRKMGAELKIRCHKTVRVWMLGKKEIPGRYVYKEQKYHYNKMPPLPSISSQWEVCAKYLVPFMRARGYHYDIEGGEFFWMQVNVPCNEFSEIKDDNIALAACEAFMEVKL